MSEQLSVEITAEWGALYDTLLALESFAERQYADRSRVPKQQQRYNDLAAVILPLRRAVDAQ